MELFVGAVAEDVPNGSRIGPTFICIIADQFRRLRDGDRYCKHYFPLWLKSCGLRHFELLCEISIRRARKHSSPYTCFCRLINVLLILSFEIFRFWYENPDVFTSAQLTEIHQSSLARVICDSSDDIKEVQKDVFKLVSHPSDYLSCESSDKIPRMDLKVWAHCCQGNSFFVAYCAFINRSLGSKSNLETNQIKTNLTK